MKIYFVTQNKFKQAEVSSYFKNSGLIGVSLEFVAWGPQEVLSYDLEEIARNKTLQAFEHLGGSPCVVEHGGLCIDALNGLPSGLSKVVWDTVGEKICTWIPPTESRKATAKSVIGYCDGKRIAIFKGETTGEIAQKASGVYQFQWDPIFIPAGSSQTYAEMGFPAKAVFSQAQKAWSQLFDYLKAASSP